MYTIQFAQRAHFLSDAAAQDILEAIREHKAFVTVPIDLAIDLAADGGDHYTVTLNVSSIVEIIRHREGDLNPARPLIPKLTVMRRLGEVSQ